VRVREFTHAIELEMEIWHDVGLARSAGFAVLRLIQHEARPILLVPG